MNYRVFYPRLFLIIGTLCAYFTARVGSLIVDYSIVLLLIFSLKKTSKNNNLFYIFAIFFLFLLFPTLIGISSGEFNFYQCFRLIARLIPFLISIFFISNKSSYEMNQFSRSNLSTLKIYTVLLAINSLLIFISNGNLVPLPLYIDGTSYHDFVGEELVRLYPLGYCLIVGSIGLGLVKKDFLWIFSSLILGILTRGRSMFIIFFISGLVTYFDIFFEKIKKFKISKNLLSIIILLLAINLTLFPWARFSQNLFEFSDENSTRNIMALDAVNKTWSESQSRFLGLGFGTESNLGYSFVDPLNLDDDFSSKLTENAKYDVETFYGMYFSRYGLVGIFLLIAILLRIQSNILRAAVLIYFLLFGLASGIIADPSAGGYILMLFFNKKFQDYYKKIKN